MTKVKNVRASGIFLNLKLLEFFYQKLGCDRGRAKNGNWNIIYKLNIDNKFRKKERINSPVELNIKVSFLTGAKTLLTNIAAREQAAPKLKKAIIIAKCQLALT